MRAELYRKGLFNNIYFLPKNKWISDKSFDFKSAGKLAK